MTVSNENIMTIRWHIFEWFELLSDICGEMIFRYDNGNQTAEFYMLRI